LQKNIPLDIVHPLAQAYAEKFTSAEEPIFKEISNFAKQHPQANMLSGHVQGKFLELMSDLIQPNRILEIGTFLGYSALCLAKGLRQGGRLHTIELNPVDAAIAVENFRKAGESDRIILHQGNALDIIPGLAETWDLVFIDADKLGYPAYYDLVLPKVRSGGMIIADNVLFHGEVFSKNIPAGSATAIHTFNKLVKNDRSVDNILLTVRDGLLLIRKK
jgi:caffeoyl-CoA O-methyltransferase